MSEQNSNIVPVTISSSEVLKKFRVHLSACKTPEEILGLLIDEFTPCELSLVDIQNAMGMEALRILEIIGERKSQIRNKEKRIKELISLLKDDFQGGGGGRDGHALPIANPGHAKKEPDIRTR